MKTLSICILAAIVTSSNGLFFSGLFGNRLAPEEFVHRHHHVHEVVHKSAAEIGGHQPSAIVRLIHHPVEVRPQYVKIYKIIHEQAPLVHGGAGGPQLGYVYQVPAHVTKVLQPIVNKNFIQSRHEHHYHHSASGHGNQGWK